MNTPDRRAARPAGPGGRRAARVQRQRARQRRLALVAGGGALLVLAASTVFLVTRGGHRAAAYTPPGRTQRTLLVEVQSGPLVVSAALFSHDGATGGAEPAAVLLPPEVIVSVPGGGVGTLQGSQVAGRAAQGRAAVADLLGVTVDAGWVLDTASLRTLVDRVGGVPVEVDVDVLRDGAVLVPHGKQRLAGPAAVQFATYLGPGEQEQARLVRLQGVLDALLTALPAAPALPALLDSLGSGSTSSLGTAPLAAVLAGLAADSRSQQLQYTLLPVVPIDAGNVATSYRVDPGPLAAMVDRLLGPSVPAGRRTGGNRVFVSNGVGTPGLGALVRNRLVAADLVFVGSRNAPSFGRPKTVILIPDAGAAARALGLRIATALRVPPGSVQTSTEVGSVADAIVVVGRDFKP